MKAVRLLVVVCFALLLASCGSKAKKDIIGKWEEIDGPETMEFSEDGTVKVVAEGLEMEGTYKFTGTDRITLEFKGPDDTAIEFPDGKVSIAEDKLTLTSPDGDATEYRRVK